MSMQFTGIENVNEFYTTHYLAAILEGDLKSTVFKEWSEEADNASTDDKRKPFEKLRALATDFFKLKADLDDEENLERRLAMHREFASKFLYTLGYEPAQTSHELPSGALPLLAEVRRADGAPVLWCIQAVDTNAGEQEDPLNLPHRSALSIQELISTEVFARDEPPRFVLLFGESQVLLIDRTKWPEKRLLRFDLIELLGRKETDTLMVTAALLERRRIWSDEGQSLLDTLDESSHKHAFSVSEDLKYALREAIELLGNEAIYYIREVKKQRLYDRALADDLSRECLRFMYRLLFLFYIEARPELGYAPMGNDAYLKGYSLESLRELELVDLTTEESINGTYLHESLKLLFKLIFEGAHPGDQAQIFADTKDDPTHGLFRLAPLNAHLFDPAATPNLSGVKLRNKVVQKIIELMSLSRDTGSSRGAGRSKNKRRGRISYAQLGINQLGAVYEALLSYRGFFAEEDLYEVKRKGDTYNPLETAYFVGKASLPKYDDDEIVKDVDTGALTMHARGTFIYRLAGRDREKSASYYTPEVLTRCLVKYAIKELIDDEMSAETILGLTVCEPAMGSAAFLNEAVNQLAEAYLQRRQTELGREIPHDTYLHEKQKVKMFIADNNVFGVDLNPIAVELAEVSLWLNTIHAGGFVPWFGTQLRCGNSLIGARRQVFERHELDPGKKLKNSPWLKLAPTDVPAGKPRPPGSVYHFFLGDEGMADYTDPVIRGKGGKTPIKGLAEEAFEAFKAWRKEFCAPVRDHEYDSMVELSDALDRLWTRHVEMLRDIRRRTTDPLDVWGLDHQNSVTQPTTTKYKDQVLRDELYSRKVRASSPYRRLDLVMDYWCALWFWPNEKYDLIPEREDFLWDLSLILDVDVLQPTEDDQKTLFPSTVSEEKSRAMVKDLGFVDIDALIARGDDTARRLELVQELAERYRFHHWELEFADIFDDRGGFDLILGNPPWLKVEWDEGGVLGDHDPFFVIKSLSAIETHRVRQETIELLDLHSPFLSAYEEAAGTQNFLKALANYPLLKGIQTNLYKCFIPQGWRISSARGVVGLLHPEGMYDDAKGGLFRKEMYHRLRGHFQFLNVKKLFKEILHWVTFSINIYGPSRHNPSFPSISNVFIPNTIDSCMSHHGYGPVPGIKDDDNKWNTQGHISRVIRVTDKELALFANLYDEDKTPALEARLPAVHSTQLVAVLRKFATQNKFLGDLKEQYFAIEMWHETNAQKDGTIRRETRFAQNPLEFIVSGPHFYVGNPSYKTPQAICKKHHDYDVLDLDRIPDDYLPRTNYIPDCTPEDYQRRTPRVPWGAEKPVTDFYRVIASRALSQTGVDQLMSA